jgi:2,3-bisphosphoglycerate-dependent phosphoglycerate mutase
MKHILTSLMFFWTTFLFGTDPMLIIIRHGQARSNVENMFNSNPLSPNYTVSHLTETGRKEVLDTSARLRAEGFNNDNIQAVYVSPLPRTQETADLLAESGLFALDKIIVDKRLIELQAGDLEGNKMLAKWNDDEAKKYHAETTEEVDKRVGEFLSDIKSMHPKGNIVVVTHNAVAIELQYLLSKQKIPFGLAEAKILPFSQ